MTNHPIERETHPMVERVAKALTGHFAPIEYDHLPAEAARAALSALRDLTPDVVEAGYDTPLIALGNGQYADAPLADQWSAIINHIAGESA